MQAKQTQSQSPEPASELTLAQAIDDYQTTLIRERVELSEGNWSKAAKSLGVHRSNLHRLARRLGLK